MDVVRILKKPLNLLSLMLIAGDSPKLSTQSHTKNHLSSATLRRRKVLESSTLQRLITIMNDMLAT